MAVSTAVETSAALLPRFVFLKTTPDSRCAFWGGFE
jgi:hypothetical protein